MTAPPERSEAGPIAVLASGGVDSAVLVGDLARQGCEVTPIYVRFGLAWESVEVSHLRRFLATLPAPGARPLVVLDLPIADVYGAHWSVSGDDVPDDETPDEAVYLPGRNLLLLAKSSVWCVLHGVEAIALGTLAGNPFPDAGRPFFDGFGGLASLAMTSRLEVLTPYAGLSKHEVLERGRGLALSETYSCIAPVDDHHCGRCNKCAERRLAFAKLGIRDDTVYADAPAAPAAPAPPAG
jgi:7-cyano-7-deazaguanine synthase